MCVLKPTLPASSIPETSHGSHRVGGWAVFTASTDIKKKRVKFLYLSRGYVVITFKMKNKSVASVRILGLYITFGKMTIFCKLLQLGM